MKYLTRPTVTVWSLLALTCSPLAASAHEFWIEPSTFGPPSAAAVGVHLCVGDAGDSRSLPRNTVRIERFASLGPDGEQPVIGMQGAVPAGVARFTMPGDYVITYVSDNAYTMLAADEFEAYLADEGLESIIAVRQLRGESRQGAREGYSRHAKALIEVGERSGAIVDRHVGLRLELVAEPFGAADNSESPRFFQLWHEGKPLAGALVKAARPDAVATELSARTDVDGRVGFPLSGPGPWRLTVVHMIPARNGIDADWESLWASLTFELPHAGSYPARSHARPTTCGELRMAYQDAHT